MPDTTSSPTDDHRQTDTSPLVHRLGTAIAFGLLIGLVITALVSPGRAPTTTAAGVTANLPAGGRTVTFDVELGDTYLKPASIDVPAGAEVVINATNVGSMEHSLALRGQDEALVAPGKTAELRWGPLTQSTQAWCTVAGHKDAGMLMDINVTGADGAPTVAAPAPTVGDKAEAEAAKIDPAASPAPGWKPFDPTVQPAQGGTTHEVTLHVTEQKVEVAPGVEQLLWTYDGTAPGPVLRGRVGDLFQVTLINNGSMNHSVDFHASKVAPNVEMRPIAPGESLVYQFRAQFAGIFTYHCGVSPMIHHMGNGMFGAVIIDPPNLAPVDKEFVFIQSELNLGADGEVMDLKKMMAGDNDAVVFNGYHNQYVHSPLQVDPSDRIRAWVVNAAVNEDLSFHVVGSIFDTVWKEGSYALQPGAAERGGSQALDLGTTQGGFVEFTLETPGQYTFVGHQMRNLSRGAAGVIVSGDGGSGAAH